MSTIALWQNTNKTLYSDIFTITPGTAGVLFATGFERERVRVTNSEFVSPQAACVQRLIHVSEASRTLTNLCEQAAAISDAEVAGNELVQVCNSCWLLTQDNNLRIIGVPGTYRLELNDATAIGVIQVYLDIYPVSNLPLQIQHLFF